jgi:mutator protein MutT
MLTVVAALIQSNGRLLVCQRRRGDTFELLWEFPGGKVKPNESLKAALKRELREELGASARIGAEVYRTRHQYAQMSDAIELVFFAAAIDSSEAANIVFEQILWRDPASLPELNFLPADRELIEKLSSGALHLPPIE